MQNRIWNDKTDDYLIEKEKNPAQICLDEEIFTAIEPLRTYVQNIAFLGQKQEAVFIIWEFKTSHERDARLFADILNFPSADSSLTQHFTNTVHQVHSTSLLKESKTEAKAPKKHQQHFGLPFRLPSYKMTPTHNSNTGLFNPGNYT